MQAVGCPCPFYNLVPVSQTYKRGKQTTEKLHMQQHIKQSILLERGHRVNPRTGLRATWRRYRPHCYRPVHIMSSSPTWPPIIFRGFRQNQVWPHCGMTNSRQRVLPSCFCNISQVHELLGILQTPLSTETKPNIDTLSDPYTLNHESFEVDDNLRKAKSFPRSPRNIPPAPSPLNPKLSTEFVWAFLPYYFLIT